VLLLYGMSLAVPVVAFVRSYEEPTMLKTFGAEYDDYRCNVPAWWPRLRPWRART
jgi:protein-S-isoprenylcysteine O-methyltransferase Ste14